MDVVLKTTWIEIQYMISRWSFAFTSKGLEDALRHLKEVLRTFLENVLTTS